MASALLSSKILKGATLKIYPGAPHGMCSTLKDNVNAELLAFIGQGKVATARPIGGQGDAGSTTSRNVGPTSTFR